jgi:hypothetical protein
MEHRRAMEILAERRVFQPSVVPGLGDSSGYIVFSAMKVLGRGATIDDAVKDALASGLLDPAPPPAPRFRAESNEVRQRDEIVAVCKSRTFASRVANALNVYQPNERGI